MEVTATPGKTDSQESFMASNDFFDWPWEAAKASAASSPSSSTTRCPQEPARGKHPACQSMDRKRMVGRVGFVSWIFTS